MCGIAGVWRPGLSPDALLTAVGRMTDAIRHRGPDGDGVWKDDASGVALGHRRLAIVDLSPTGRQPMISRSGRFTITFNGEVYNFRDLRVALEHIGAVFRGTSDTEVLLAAFDAWGVEASLPRFHGMFALAVWDRDQRCLWIARDRLGEKPVFIFERDGAIAFASELKALRALPEFRSDVNPVAIDEILRRGCTRGRTTIYSDVRKLLPGECVRFWRDATGLRSDYQPYWSIPAALDRVRAAPTYASDDDAVDALEELLLGVVRDEMISDVALGAFLSGGIDSSLIVALMQRVSANPVRTFTVGFREASHDESPFAAAVAKHVGTEHTQVILSARDALALVPQLSTIFDEPFADSSQLPTLLVASTTRQHVTVALSGDGGDELFGGYSQYMSRDGLAAVAGRVPAFARAPVAALIDRVPPTGSWSTGGERWRPNSRARLSTLLRNGGAAQSYDALLAMIGSPRDVLVNSPREGSHAVSWPIAASVAESQMAYDMQTYLPDDILVKVDRAAMHYSLETRAPLLDHRVVEFALAQPLHRKVRDGRGKFLLRRLLERHVPRELIDRPKRGFAIPLGDWLCGDLRAWGKALIAPDETFRRWFRPAVVASLWQEHQRGTDRSVQLWPILMVLQWLRENHA